MGGREQAQGEGPSWKHEPGGGRGGCCGSESGSVCLAFVLSRYCLSLLQGDVCFPRCESSIMGPPGLPTMSFSGQYSCFLPSVLFTASPAEPHTATTTGEKAVSPGRDGFLSQSATAVSPFQSRGGGHGEQRQPWLFLLLLD